MDAKLDAALRAAYHADELAKCAVVAHYTERLCSATSDIHLGYMHERFERIAEALGYRIEKIVAVESPDLAETEGAAA